MDREKIEGALLNYNSYTFTKPTAAIYIHVVSLYQANMNEDGTLHCQNIYNCISNPTNNEFGIEGYYKHMSHTNSTFSNTNSNSLVLNYTLLATVNLLI